MMNAVLNGNKGEAMTILEFMAELRGMGIRLWAEGENLRYQAPKGKLEKDVLQRIAARKGEILQFLKQVSLDAKSLQESIPAVNRSDALEVSFSQQSLWFYDQLVPGSAVYNIPNAIRITGALDEQILRQALRQTALRHEALRTVFENVQGNPAQRILPEAEVLFQTADLTLLNEAEREAALKDGLEAEAWKPFDLQKGPLWRIMLFKTGERETVLLLTIHHIITDAWSNGIFVREFFALYDALSAQKPAALPPQQIQFADYAAWQRKRFATPEIKEPLLEYWRKQLDNPTVLGISTDFPRPAVQSFSGDSRTLTFSAEMTARLKTFCASEDVTVFMLLLTAFQTLLHRWCAQEDILVGTVAANRGRLEITGMIGFIMNTLVLRTDFSGNPTLRELLSRVKAMTLDAYAHQEMPFDSLLEELKPERDMGRTPLFQVMYIHQNTEEVQLRLSGFEIAPVELKNKVAPFELRLITEEKNGRISCRMDYCTDLFKASTMDRFLLQLEQMADTILSQPQLCVDDFSVLTPAESDTIINTFNNTAVPFPKDKRIHQMFEEQAEKNPDAAAVVFEGETVSYGELNRRANRLAYYLKKRGVGADKVVGVCLERSVEMVVSLLGILKAGGAYVPFDPHYPKDRVEYMIRNSGAQCMIAAEKFLELIPEFGGDILCIDKEREKICAESEMNPPCEVTDENLAYVIYTSGSTGEPKGCMNTHLGMRNHKQWMQHTYRLTPQDRVLQKTPFSFDVSVWEFFWPLINGACLVVAKPEGHKDPSYLIRTIREQGITVIHFVPSMLSIFLEHPEVKSCTSLRHVFSSGEALSLDLQRRFFETFDVPLYNVYGPAECADVSTAWTCRPEYSDRIVPIGTPIANVQTYILDKALNPVPVGVVGELCVSGDGVGKGYINRPDITAERFPANPFKAGTRLYKTGDLAKYREDGVIEYAGRSDFQVKIRGMRIELSEIERVLGDHPAIHQNTVIAWEKEPGNLHLVCYAVFEKDKAVPQSELTAYLLKSLPDYMVPRIFVFLESLPLLANGKINRKALPEPEPIKREDIVPPSNETEERIAAIWKEALGVSEVGVYDNFFEVGGHSLLLTKIHSRLNAEFEREFSLIDLFTYSTIAAFAKFVSGEEEEAGGVDKERLEKQRQARQQRRQSRRQEA